MSLSRYKAYTNGQAEWLWQIPSHWSLPPLYLRYQTELGKMLDTSRITGKNLLPYLRNVDVQWGSINLADLPAMDVEPSELSRYTVRVGDLLVCEGGEVGRAAVVDTLLGPTGFQKALHRLRAVQPGEVPKYMFYVFCWAVNAGIFTNNGQSTIAHLTGEQLRKYRFPRPPFDEQTGIAVFLDRETAKIDTLIAVQERLIVLLAEKRQATISHAITKGLNRDAPTKDSGVAWLGNVPAHWRVLRMKRVVSTIEQGWSPQCENFPVEESNEWGVLKVGCVNGGVFNHMENKKLPSELEPIPEYALRSGDLLVSRANTRELVGSAAVVTRDYDRLLLCDKLYRLRLHETECVPEFVAAYLSARVIRSQIELEATGASSSMLNIGQSVVLNLPIPLPSYQEQREVMRFLQSENFRLNELSNNAENAIVLLKERRSALIAAAVTGQIDVRGTIADGKLEMKAAA